MLVNSFQDLFVISFTPKLSMSIAVGRGFHLPTGRQSSLVLPSNVSYRLKIAFSSPT